MRVCNYVHIFRGTTSTMRLKKFIYAQFQWKNFFKTSKQIFFSEFTLLSHFQYLLIRFHIKTWEDYFSFTIIR